MKQEQKELLLKDLCARLPYGVKAIGNYSTNFCSVVDTIEGILPNNYIVIDGCNFDISNIKLYLFPLSSMTEEQKNELQKIIYVETEMICNQLKTNNYGIEDGKYHFNSTLQVDWLNKNHFDYRGLIPMWLALDATGLNIY